MVRCLICFLRFPKLKNICHHYCKSHSKNKIIRKLLQITNWNPNHSFFKCRKKYKQQNVTKTAIKKSCRKINTFKIGDLPSESLVLSEHIRIFCGDDEIIRIGDSKHSVKLSFEDQGNESKEISCLSLKEIERDNDKCLPDSTENNKGNVNKKKIKRKKATRKKKQNVQINTKKLKEFQCPTGIFENGCLDPGHLRILTSDTESCSETSKNSFIPPEDTKVFCPKCGSGYKTEYELSEHMYIHEPFCRLCNTWFPDEYIFKQHMQLHKIKVFVCHFCSAEFAYKEILLKHFDSHMEDKLFEDVLDMEDEYKTFQFSFVNNNNYSSSINNILCYLQDVPDFYYKCMKTVCDICYKEVLFHEYERHLQIFHNY